MLIKKWWSKAFLVITGCKPQCPTVQATPKNGEERDRQKLFIE